METLRAFRDDRSGATAIEYAVISARIGIAILTTIHTIGQKLETSLNAVRDLNVIVVHSPLPDLRVSPHGDETALRARLLPTCANKSPADACGSVQRPAADPHD